MRHTFNLCRRSIRLFASNKGEKYIKATGLTIDPKLWNSKARTLSAKCKDSSVLEELRKIHFRLEEKERPVMSEAEVLSAMDYALSGDAPKPAPKKKEEGVPSFWEYFKEWSERPSSSKRQRTLAYKNVSRFMGTKENWEDIDESYHYRLLLKMQNAGFAPNYQWKMVQELRTVLNEGVRLKYRKDLSFRDWKNPREKTFNIALTDAEVDRIRKVELPTETLRATRDLFLVGYYTGARFSDYSRISLDNVRDGRLEFTQEKTGGRVLIPLSPKLKAILEAYGGHAPKQCNQVFNRQIKEVAKLAGICAVVDLPKEKRKEWGTPTYRWEMVSSHTARRSCLSNLYLSGVPAKYCMAISGHKTLSAFETYICMDNEMAVSSLEKLDFFK